MINNSFSLIYKLSPMRQVIELFFIFKFIVSKICHKQLTLLKWLFTIIIDSVALQEKKYYMQTTHLLKL